MYINGKSLKVKRYSSGELKFIKSDMDSYVVDGKVKILHDNKFSFFELLLVLNYYIKKNVLIDLVLGYLPYQRMDHKGRDELDTLNYVIDIINNMNLNSVTVCEPHCDINGFKNGKCFGYIDVVKEYVYKEIGFDIEKDIVVLTDKGGLKRYGNMSKNAVYFDKERDLNTGLIVKHSIVGNIDTNRNLLIVDDIISTGDTIVNIIEELTKLGAKKIFVLSGHIENNKYNKRIFDYENVIKVYSTNSLKKMGSKKLKLYDVKEIVYGKNSDKENN